MNELYSCYTPDIPSNATLTVLVVLAFLVGVACGYINLAYQISKTEARLSDIEEGREGTNGMATFWKEDYKG